MPDLYMSINWPIRYASISSDGKLIAIAGRRGLTHYSVPSGRWKLFEDERQERDFVVRGGLLWYRHVLVAAIDVGKTHLVGETSLPEYAAHQGDSPLLARHRSSRSAYPTLSATSRPYTGHVPSGQFSIGLHSRQYVVSLPHPARLSNIPSAPLRKHLVCRHRCCTFSSQSIVLAHSTGSER